MLISRRRTHDEEHKKYIYYYYHNGLIGETMVATNDDTRQIKTTHGTQTHRLSFISPLYTIYR